MKLGNKNEFQMAILAAKKALQKQVDDNPKSGVVFDKGLYGESNIRNVEAIESLDRLYKYFTDRKRRGWERCDNCGEVKEVARNVQI